MYAIVLHHYSRIKVPYLLFFFFFSRGFEKKKKSTFIVKSKNANISLKFARYVIDIIINYFFSTQSPSSSIAFCVVRGGPAIVRPFPQTTATGSLRSLFLHRLLDLVVVVVGMTFPVHKLLGFINTLAGVVQRQLNMYLDKDKNVDGINEMFQKEHFQTTGLFVYFEIRKTAGFLRNMYLG